MLSKEQIAVACEFISKDLRWMTKRIEGALQAGGRACKLIRSEDNAILHW